MRKNPQCLKRGQNIESKKQSKIPREFGRFSQKKFQFFSKKIQVLNFWLFCFKTKEQDKQTDKEGSRIPLKIWK